jgi:hypothetical protein
MKPNGPADAGPFDQTRVGLADYEHFASAEPDAELWAGGFGLGA